MNPSWFLALGAVAAVPACGARTSFDVDDGRTGSPIADDAGSGNGVEACVRNVCGGCGALAARPGERCGACGVYVCTADGASLSCSDPGGIGVRAVAAGAYHTCVLTKSGGVRCWGILDGDPIGAPSLTPPTLNLMSAVETIAAGDGHTCAVMSGGGGVRCWGNNLFGQLGDGSMNSRPWPLTLDVLEGAATIAAGEHHSCALTNAGVVRCWGYNASSQLGIPTDVDRTTLPTRESLAGVQGIAAGALHTCALMKSGGVRCWGAGGSGQLGNNSVGRVFEPPAEDVLTAVRAIAAGSQHTCALMNSGGVRCWGRNHGLDPDQGGQLGDGSTTERIRPPANDVLADVSAIAAGAWHSCALTNSGGVRCWGANAAGQLGDGTTKARTSPPVSDVLTGAVAVAAGVAHTCAVTSSGVVQCWGSNQSGQLGDGTTTTRAVPAPTLPICP